MITRRVFTAASLAGLAAPALWLGTKPAAAQESVLRAKVIADLQSLDPVWTTAYITRNHGYMVFDTLFGMDADQQFQPQMVDTYEVSDDLKLYTFTLRDSLAFHDGAPVTSEDCIASLRRWGAKDALGSKLLAVMDDFETVDDKTFRIKLKQPWSLVIPALGKVGSTVPFIMPARLAATPATEQVTEMVGSGPFRFVADEYVPGAKAVYVRNDDYVARDEPPSGTAGGKVVNIERVEWHFLDDVTAMNALQLGEIDFFEEPSPEILPVLRAMGNLTVEVTNPLGLQLVIRPNHTQAPFDNVKVRQAFMAAINPQEHLLTYVNDPELFTQSGSAYPAGSPYSTEDGAVSYDPERAKALLEEAGYDGTPIIVLQATNIATNRIFSTVTAEQLRKAGFNVQVEASDFGTMFGRALKNDPAQPWHLIHFANIGPDMLDPVINRMVWGSGDYLGWAKDDEIVGWQAAFLAEPDFEKRKDFATQIQVKALDLGFYFPGGMFRQPYAFANTVQGVVTSPVPVYWNLTKAG